MEKKLLTNAIGTNTTAKYVTRTRFVFIFIARLFSSMEMIVVASEMMFCVRICSRSMLARRELKSDRRMANLECCAPGLSGGRFEGARIVERISRIMVR